MIKVEERAGGWSTEWAAADDLEDDAMNSPSLWEAEIMALPADYAAAAEDAYEDG